MPSRRSAPSGRQSLSGEARAGWSYTRGHRHLLIALASTIGAFLIIAVMGAYQGYNSSGGALGVGRATTNAVVGAIVLILAVNYLITAFFVE